MKKTIVLGIVFLVIGVSLTPVISGSSKEVKNNKVVELLNKKSEELEIIVDQAVDSPCPPQYGARQIKCHMPIGQSFMPLYECHYGIELKIKDGNPEFPLVPIEICLKEDNITGPIVPGTNVTLNLTWGDGWRFFEFDSPVYLTINNTYVIDISTTNIRWGIYDTGGSCYTRGISYFHGTPQPNMDNYFRTYVLILSYPVANFTYFAEESPVMFNGSSSCDLDGEIVSYEWDFGDGTTGTGEITYHKYCEVGTYDVKLTVTDDDGLKGNITKSVDVIFANIPPWLDIDGPSQGKPGVIYEYIFMVVDYDGDEFYLWVDWGNNNSTGWIGPYFPDPSIDIKLNNAWNKTGTYIIKAKLRDFCGESNWAEFTVTIPRNKAVTNNMLLLRILERLPLLQRILDVWRLNNQ